MWTKEMPLCNVAVYELALGGTAVGTGLNTHKDYAVKSMLADWGGVSRAGGRGGT